MNGFYLEMQYELDAELPYVMLDEQTGVRLMAFRTFELFMHVLGMATCAPPPEPVVPRHNV